MAITIGVANQKGGVGTTTSVIEIANNLAIFERKVLVIDLDPQANFSKYLDADLTKPTIYEALHGDIQVNDIIQQIGRIDVMPASEDLSKADREFVGIDDVYLLSDLIEIIQDKYQYILVDTGPARNILLNMTYIASDYIIVPCVPDDGALYGIDKVTRDISQLRDGKRQISHAKLLSLILNNYHTNYNNDAQKLANIKYLREQIKDKPEVYTVRTFTGTSECKSMKMAIIDYDKNATAAIDFRNLTYDLMEKMEANA